MYKSGKSWKRQHSRSKSVTSWIFGFVACVFFLARTVLHPSHPLCPCLVRRRVFLGCSNPTRSVAALPPTPHPAYCSVIFIVLRGRNMTDTRQLNPGFRTRTSQLALLSVFGSEKTRLHWIKSSRPSYCCHENKSRCCSIETLSRKILNGSFGH